MTYRYKLSRRLALIRDHALVSLVLVSAACQDTGPLGSSLDPVDFRSNIVALLASSDNPTVAAAQPTQIRAMAVTATGSREAVDAEWLLLDGGTLTDSVVGSDRATFFSANAPGVYRLVSFDLRKQFRDTTTVTIPHQTHTLAKLYLVPAIASLAVGGSQQFFVYGETSSGDSVAVPASLSVAEGGQASGLLYSAGRTPGTYRVIAQQQGGTVADTATVTISSSPVSPPAPSPTPPPVLTPPPSSPITGSPAELPRVYLDTRYPSMSGRTLVVPAGGSLQAALNSAARGDVIELMPGATYTGNYTLPAKPGTGWVVIRTAGTLPPEGTRVTPASAANFAKIRTPNAMPAFRTEVSGDASYYRLTGLDIGSTATMTFALVYLGDDQGDARSVSQLPSHIYLDRVWVHGTPTQAIQRCVALNSRSSAVVDSYLSDCHMKNQDSQAIIGWAGPGPYKIVNNYVSGAGENIMFGGGDPPISGLVPSDIEIRGNHIHKPLEWKTSDRWTVKNLYESKNSQRVLIENNILENNWRSGQTGIAIVLKSENQSGRCTWCTTSDYTMRYNKIINSPGGFAIDGSQVTVNGGASIPAARITISHNLFDAVALNRHEGATRLFQIGARLTDLVISHNNAFPDGYLFFMAGGAGSTTHFVLRDNLLGRGALGVFGDATAEGIQSMQRYAPQAVFRGNVLIGGDVAKYPAGNAFPAGVLSAGLSPYGIESYVLGSTTYSSITTDGQPAGVDMAELTRRLAGVD